MRKVRLGVTLVGPEFALEAEIRVLEEDTGMVETGAANGELVEGGPARRGGSGCGGGRVEIRDEGRNGLRALDPVTDGPN